MSQKPTYQAIDQLPLVLTIPEVGAALRIGLNTAYDLIRCGKIDSVKVGRQRRVPKAALLKYLEENCS